MNFPKLARWIFCASGDFSANKFMPYSRLTTDWQITIKLNLVAQTSDLTASEDLFLRDDQTAALQQRILSPSKCLLQPPYICSQSEDLSPYSISLR